MSFLSLILARTLPFMLTEIYIEALLVDEGLSDQLWEMWDVGMNAATTTVLAELNSMRWRRSGVCPLLRIAVIRNRLTLIRFARSALSSYNSG